MAKQESMHRYSIELEYEENVSSFFEVRFNDNEESALSLAIRIARGILMRTMACRVIVWNKDGYPEMSFRK